MLRHLISQPRLAQRQLTARHRHLWLLAAAFTLALFVGLLQAQPAYAQANCTIAPRSQSVDRNGNGMIDSGETFTLEGCRQRTFTIDGETKTVRVSFTTANGQASDQLVAVDSNGDGTNDVSPQAMADFIALWTENAWTIFRNYGFNDPMGRDDMNVHVFDMRPGLAGWCCTSENYEIDTPSVLSGFRSGGDRRWPESIAFHEMWHAAEWSGSFGCWVNEGTASNMTDHVNPSLDTYLNNDYIGRARGYLGSGTGKSLLNHCYDGALWWKYFMQEAGTVRNDLDQGVDAMVDFWRNSGPTDFSRMDNVIRTRRPGRTLESMWIDFAVANYAKEYSGPVVTSRYRYVDEQEPSAPDYPAPTLTGNFNLTNAALPAVVTDIPSWASHYYQFNINPAVPFIDLDVRQDVNKRLGYVLLLMRNDQVVQEIRSVGRNFTQSFANASYTRMVLIVVGLSDFANYRFIVNGMQPSLNIVDPLAGRKAYAGRIDAPDKILVKVEVLNADALPIAGIDPNTFTVTVGSRVVQPGDRISAAYVQGQYWLLMRAPTQTVAGNYNLTVQYPSLSDTETSAVRYEERNDTDNVLVIDRSGSMGFFGGGTEPMNSAKDAARLYASSWRDTDQIGVVQFNDTAQVALTLRPWNDTSRNDAYNAIEALTPSGGTCIGCGAQTGLDELIARGDPANDWALIVLSDGQENVGAITNFISAYNARRDAGNQVPVVHTVALGPDADRARLEDLAAKTGGTYSFASIPEASAAAVQANELSNNLGEIYREISEEVVGHEQVYNQTSVFATLPFTHNITVDGAASEAVFVLQSDTNLGGVVRAFLYDPSGDLYEPTVEDGPNYDNHYIWRIPSPEPGVWQLAIFPNIIDLAGTNQGNVPASPDQTGPEYLIEAAVDSDVTLDLFLGLPVEERLVGEPMPVFASLAGSQPISNATMTAFVRLPNGGTSFFNLYDDGAHEDGGAGDGFYGGTFYQTQQWGSYDLVVTAEGSDTIAGPFVRRQRLGFNMLQTRVLDDPDINPNADPNADPNDPDPNDTDEDNDGLPDRWEEEHDLDPTSNDAGEDPDNDGLNNQEEFENGTDPHQSDSDNGGQNDGNEVDSGTDPTDPSDDQVPCPYSFTAENFFQGRDELESAGDNVILLYDVAADHATVTIQRAESEAGPLQTIISQTVATGIYTDSTVSLGITYYYWLTAFDAEGHASCVRGPAQVTPTEDPVAPEGVVLINDGARETNNTHVTLSLNASADTREMQIRNDLNFDLQSGWEPYVTGKPWVIEPEEGVAFVFVLFRDEAGNISEAEFDSIELANILFEERIHLPQLSKNDGSAAE